MRDILVQEFLDYLKTQPKEDIVYIIFNVCVGYDKDELLPIFIKWATVVYPEFVYKNNKLTHEAISLYMKIRDTLFAFGRNVILSNLDLI